jgi:acetolactate decarboxylase
MELSLPKSALYLGLTALVCWIGCGPAPQESTATVPATYPSVQVVGAMKNVMWKGQLGSRIKLDTLSDRKGLYGLGPLSYLRGELLINNGKSYLSEVTSDSSMKVTESYEASAPFFVYARVQEWDEIELPSSLKTIPELEAFIDERTKDFKRPFAFKLSGQVAQAMIHIQNLPKGTKVSSPAEAHQGQTSYAIEDEAADIVGFFSTEHQGIFTHHDSFLHMHLITQDESKMGHLDELQIGTMKLFLPKS